MSLQLNAREGAVYVVETPKFEFIDMVLTSFKREGLQGTLIVTNTETDKSSTLFLSDQQNVLIPDTEVWVNLGKRPDGSRCLYFTGSKELYPVYRLEVFLKEYDLVS